MNKLESTSKTFFLRVFIKGFILFAIFNFLFIGIDQFPIGKISLYNSLIPGRERFPFGENPSISFNLTINDFDAMFASLKLDKEIKGSDEYRVFIFGDSSVWGSLQSVKDTLSGQLNTMAQKGCNGQRITTFDLGYPTLSILKDLTFIDQSLVYKPDLILWLVTLESLPKENQFSSELLKNNVNLINLTLKKYGLENVYQFKTPSDFDLTFLGQRRNLADLIRLQGYGIMWAASGIDQDLKSPYIPARRDFEEDNSFHDLGQGDLTNELSLDVLEEAANKISVPIIIINEPILISQGKNSEIRYNYYYPRWAYDQYRIIMKDITGRLKIPFYDFYNLVPENMFTNSAIHMNNVGENKLAREIAPILTDFDCSK